ncbi:MAG: DUF4349 domain-containing protein [Anaerolineae bacterium]|nr:DUF4349 domain-containing protein [Anaerolineae bacterium]
MSTKQKRWLLIGGGIVVAICVIVFFGLMLLNAPAIGSVQSSNMAVERQLAPGGGEGFVGGGDFYDEDKGISAAMEEAPMAPEPGTAPSSSTTNSDQHSVERLIIRNGSITVAVEDTLTARQNIEDMVEQMSGEGAFVVSVNEHGSGSTSDPYVDMTIRVPAAHFDEVMNRIAGMAAEGTTPTQSQSAEDVTNQYVDLDARLETLEAARQRLLEIMSEAQNAEDLLYAEQQLTQREAEIASIKGQMQYLSQSAALSSINVSLQPYILSQPVDNRWRPAETVRRAWEALLRSLRGFGNFAIIFGISILPWLAAAGLVIFGIVRFVRSRIRKAQEKQVSGIEEQ